MKSIADACADGRIDGRIAVVVGNFADSPALARAAELGIPIATVKSPSASAEPHASEIYGKTLLDVLQSHGVELVCLAGYIRKIPGEVIEQFPGRIMNIHNALIPSFCGKGMYGMNVHQAAVDYGVKVSGCTVHFVDEGYDTGPIIMQSTVPVYAEDTAEDVSARVLVAEHDTYWRAINLFAQGRLKIDGRKVSIANAGSPPQPLPEGEGLSD